MENNINLTFYSHFVQKRLLNTDSAKIGAKELIYNVATSAVFLVTYTNTCKETGVKLHAQYGFKCV